MMIKKNSNLMVIGVKIGGVRRENKIDVTFIEYIHA